MALSLLVSLTLAASMAACDRAPERPPNAGAPATASTLTARSPVPAATEGARTGDTANANAPPMKLMTKEEESASMPQPGQANDHSTTAKDKK